MSPSQPPHQIKRRWRDYRIEMGRRPVKEFLDGLSFMDVAAIATFVKDVRKHGLVAARYVGATSIRCDQAVIAKARGSSLPRKGSAARYCSRSSA